MELKISNLELKTQEEWKCLEFTWLKAKCFQGPSDSENIWNISSGPEIPESQAAAWTVYHPLAFFALVISERDSVLFHFVGNAVSENSCNQLWNSNGTHHSWSLAGDVLGAENNLKHRVRFSHNWRVLKERVKCMRADGHFNLTVFNNLDFACSHIGHGSQALTSWDTGSHHRKMRGPTESCCFERGLSQWWIAVIWQNQKV